MMNKDVLFKEIVNILKKRGVEKAVLFGSFSYGKPNAESDIDLLAIKNIPEEEVRKLRIEIKKDLWVNLKSEKRAFDVIVDSEARMRRRIALGDKFYDEILNKGKILYEQ
ncbi:nucleotidyltransferase domain-containing protein [Marinilabilia salmonicolor]|nr:nucleotidyltransferase domain-containing protein [Marinilabilia salmonicolor]